MEKSERIEEKRKKFLFLGVVGVVFHSGRGWAFQQGKSNTTPIQLLLNCRSQILEHGSVESPTSMTQ